MDTRIDVVGLGKLYRAEVLAALYNGSRQQGMGFMDERGSRQMSVAEAEKILAEEGHDFDYLRGRVMKIGLGGDKLEIEDFRLYDRDNGEGAGLLALRNLKPIA